MAFIPEAYAFISGAGTVWTLFSGVGVSQGGVACQSLEDKSVVKQENMGEKLRKLNKPHVLLLWKITMAELFSI